MKAKFVNIEADGVQYPVCFNINALRDIERASGKSIGEIESYSQTIEGIAIIATIGLNHGARVAGEKGDALTVDQVGDTFNLDQLTEIVNAITEFLPDQKKAKPEVATKNQ
jgi:hypothetical protein